MRVRRHAIRIAAGTGVAVLATTCWAQTPSLTFIPPPAGRLDSFVSGISADGRYATGYSYPGATTYSGFTWTREGGLNDWGSSPGVPSPTVPVGISNDGSVVTGYRDFTGPGGVAMTESFRYVNGTYTVLGPNPPNTNIVRASGASGDGSIVVGTLLSSTFQREGGAFRWTPSTGIQDIGKPRPTDLGSRFTGMSRDGTTAIGVGVAGNNGGDAYTWTQQGGWRSLPAPAGTAAIHDSNPIRVSSDGRYVVGDIRPTDGSNSGITTAVIWRDSVPSYLGTFGSDWYMSAGGVSDDGRIIAGSARQLGTFQYRATIWIDGSGPILLQDYLASLGISTPAGWTLSGIGYTTPDGHTMLGLAERGTQQQAFIVTIPTPASLPCAVLFGGWTAYCRRRAANPARPTLPGASQPG